MLVQYRNSSYALNCDWLQYSVLTSTDTPTFGCPAGYRFELCQGNNIFSKRGLLYNAKGEKVLTLLWSPYSKVLNKRLMTVQVANQWLYENRLAASFPLVQEIVDCVFNTMGRVDLAMDFEINGRQLDMIKHIRGGHIYVQNKKEGSDWWHVEEHKEREKKACHCLSFGSMSSEIKLKVYNKSRELMLAGGEQEGVECEKPWIVNCWKQAGLDVQYVWRVEFSMKATGQMMWNDEPLTLERLDDDSFMLGAFLDMYHQRFICRYNTGKQTKEHNRDKRVYLLDLPLSEVKMKWKDLNDVQEEYPHAIALLRELMRTLNNPAVMVNRHVFRSIANSIQEVVRMHCLERYFVSWFGKECDDYLSDMVTHVGLGVHEVVVPPERFME
jgi:hypothetical protein